MPGVVVPLLRETTSRMDAAREESRRLCASAGLTPAGKHRLDGTTAVPSKSRRLSAVPNVTEFFPNVRQPRNNQNPFFAREEGIPLIRECLAER
jgi:hypothetical protein